MREKEEREKKQREHQVRDFAASQPRSLAASQPIEKQSCPDRGKGRTEAAGCGPNTFASNAKVGRRQGDRLMTTVVHHVKP